MTTSDKNALASTEKQSHNRLIPASDWPKHHPWPPIGGLRYLIFNAEHNGVHKAIRRVGRRVLIDEDAFFQWVDEQGVQP